MSVKYFVSGDIHSFYEHWIRYLTNAGFDIENPDHKIIICGDLFDRGSETVQCFEFVKMLAERERLIYIRGNHEDLLHSCVSEIRKTSDIRMNHITNGTLQTVADFVGVSPYDILCNCYDKSQFDSKINELLSFIDTNSVDYFEFGNYIFVHGWVPTSSDDPDKFHARKNHTLMNREDWDDESWDKARWSNGMLCWSQGAVPEGKTVVCGHWHTSWGHHKFHGHKHEFPNLNIIKAKESFKPFVEDGIIALDGCVAYSGLVNVGVFTADKDNLVIEKL